jgi:FMN reductase
MFASSNRSEKLLVVGIGGTVRPGSSTEAALAAALELAASQGAQVVHFTGARLAELPLYSPSSPERSRGAVELIETVRRADGLIVASPGYHASISGMVKNALDYMEDLREDERPYLSRRSVGCIATGAGWQATVSTLAALRAIVHSLRGWPTPLGATINTAPGASGVSGEKAALQLRTVASEVVEFARLQAQAPAAVGG